MSYFTKVIPDRKRENGSLFREASVQSGAGSWGFFVDIDFCGGKAWEA